jgi:hypothetical protein
LRSEKLEVKSEKKGGDLEGHVSDCKIRFWEGLEQMAWSNALDAKGGYPALGWPDHLITRSPDHDPTGEEP